MACEAHLHFCLIQQALDKSNTTKTLLTKCFLFNFIRNKTYKSSYLPRPKCIAFPVQRSAQFGAMLLFPSLEVHFTSLEAYFTSHEVCSPRHTLHQHFIHTAQCSVTCTTSTLLYTSMGVQAQQHTCSMHCRG